MMGTGVSMPFPQTSGPDDVPDFVPDEILNRVISLASTVAEEGLDGTREMFVDLANEIAPTYLEHTDLFPSNLATISDTESVLSNNRAAIKSILDELNVSLNLGIAGRTAAMFAYASKIGGILLAIGSIGKASVGLHRANTTQELPPDRIDDKKYQQFGFALLGLCIELSLWMVPLNYRFAWKGTRYFSNQVLYRVQRLLPAATGRLVHTILMILTHWFQRLGLEIAQGHLYDVANGLEYAVSELQALSQELDFDSRYQADLPTDSILWTPSNEEFLKTLSQLVQDFPFFKDLLEEDIIQNI